MDPVTDTTVDAPYELTGRVALVTGGGAGLGRQFSFALASAGATVAVVARRRERLEAVVGEIEAHGGKAFAVPVDITETDAVTAALDTIESKFGVVDILVNNAGIPDAQYATRMTPELVGQVIDLNMRAPWMLSCEIARRLIEAKASGRIINISSMSAFSYGGHGAALYSTTKAAVNRMTEVLAVEWARFGINVNAIAPGAFSTEMLDGMVERMGNFSKAFPRRRFGRPDQLDSTLLYLASPRSDAVTGTIIKVDDAQGSR
ncbi:MAG TPA: SDR family NAD(P)-dependent oxidoreductase [Ilumatobacter sp.]|nr:SDR family NAD(P)-dependent oxidoreductase [Ilumatobacter sp.]